MKRFALPALMIALFAANLRGEENNIVMNGDFSVFRKSTGAVGGWRKAWPQNQGTAGADKETFKSSPSSFKMSNESADQDTLQVQYIKLKPKTEYVLSFWMKGENIKGKTPRDGARYFLLHKGKTFRDGSCRGLWKPATGSFDWTKVELSFNSEDKTVLALLLGLRKASGTVWYDDLQITEKDLKKKVIEGALFPVDFQKDNYSIAQDFPGCILLSLKGERRNSKNLKVRLDLPEGFEFLGSCPWVAPLAKNGIWQFAQEKATREKIERNNKTYTRVVIEISSSMINKMNPKNYSWGNYDRIYIENSKGKAPSGTVYWQLQSDSFSGKEKSFLLTTLPPIKYPANKTEKFKLMICYLWHATAPIGKVADAYLDYWTLLSDKPFTLDFFGWNKVQENIRASILEKYRMALIVGSDKAMPRLPGAKAYNKTWTQMIQKNGKPLNSAVSPEYLIEDPQGIIWDKHFPEGIKEKMKKIPSPKALLFDIEPGADSGYGEKNRIAFQKFAKLSSLPSKEEICKKYSREWFDFRVEQHSLIVKKMSESMKKYFPGIPLWLCSDPIHSEGETLSGWCAVDVRKSDADVACHANMPYYSGLKFYNDIELNLKELKKPNFPLIDPAEKLESFFQRYTPEKTKQNIVAAAALGCIGIGFWPGDVFDGKYLRKIAEAYNIVSLAEDYYFSENSDKMLNVKFENVFQKAFKENDKETRVSFPDFEKTLKHKLHRKGNDFLATLINYNDKDAAILSLSIPALPEGNYSVTDPENNERYCKEDQPVNRDSITKGFLAEVPPSGVKVLLISQNAPETARTLKQSDIARQLAEQKKMLASFDRFPEKKEGEAQISWSDIEGDGSPEMILKNTKGQIYINISQGAKIVGWKFRNDNLKDILFHKSRGFLDEIAFYDLEQKKAPYPFKLKSIDVEDGAPEAAFEYSVPAFGGANPKENPLEGLFVEKSIKLKKQGAEIEISYRLTNKNSQKKKIRFGFRVKNYPRLGGSFAGEKALSQIARISYASPSGKTEIKSGSPVNNLLLTGKVERINFLKDSPSLPWATESEISIVAANDEMSEKLTITPSVNCAGFYSWWQNAGNFTVELLSKEFSLDYGKSINFKYSILYSK